MKPLIVSLSAQNIHKAPAAWYLKAYYDSAHPEAPCDVLEASVNERPHDVLRRIHPHGHGPVCFSCYIWNILFVTQLARALRALEPGRVIVLGGPEVSFENDLRRFPFADYIIQGPGEITFCCLMDMLQAGNAPARGVLCGAAEDFSRFPSPFTPEYFASFDEPGSIPIGNQLIYYESSRGCPFSCSYCLSCVPCEVQYLELSRVEEELELLLSRGARTIKFVDRTFNANARRASALLRFVQSLQTDCVFHFEVAADLFTEEMLTIIEAMTPNRVQFEIGIQTLNSGVLDNVRRKTNIPLVLENIRRLISMGNCHIHTDLIAGLPGEDLASFKNSFNGAVLCRPHMLQLGFLKILRGSLMADSAEYPGFIHDEIPPYEVLRSDSMGFHELAQLHGVERALNRYYNSGMFAHTLDYVFFEAKMSPFTLFHALWEYCERDALWNTDMRRTVEIFYNFLLQAGLDSEIIADCIRWDCACFHIRSVLPQIIPAQLDCALEAKVRAACSKAGAGLRKIRVVNLGSRLGARVFFYDIRNPVSKEYYSLPVSDDFEEVLRRFLHSRTAASERQI